ncbi:hypothetical protein HMPREF0973_02219 [Prevotella veroralis F0319]|uniref:Uncharacterized protein n=1 Tax=Prevotella veroralis F0319 TaxID=649761 RepID=C9MRG7_9BACT|nr:hypothetical protein HMPREF0973_02219 [Prevotella veroralis F0319]
MITNLQQNCLFLVYSFERALEHRPSPTVAPRLYGLKFLSCL